MALRTISANSWLFGGKFVLERTWVLHGNPPPTHTFKGPLGAYYTFSSASNPAPKTTRFITDLQIHRVNKKGKGGVWRIGGYYLKLSEVSEKMTQEYRTIRWLGQRKEELSFNIPDLVYHAEEDGFYMMVLSRVPGEPLMSVWKRLLKDEKDYYVKETVRICKELSCFTYPHCAGMDMAAGTLQEFVDLCYDLGIMPDKFHFSHGDLHPGNMLVRNDGEARKALRSLISHPDGPKPDVPLISIINWELASFVPIEWIATSPFLLKRIMYNLPQPLSEFLTMLEKQFAIDSMPNVLQKWEEKRGLRYILNQY